MAATGKKINELTAISTVTDQTVLPSVYVDGSSTASTATKITISQISEKIQNDMSSTLSSKQDTLVSGNNIKTVNGTSILGSGDLTVNTYQEFKEAWPTTTTFAEFLSAINSDNTAAPGMGYMGDLKCSGLPSELPNNANVEAIVEIMNSTTNSKAIHVTITSGNTSPYRWEYTYWNNGQSVSGWLSWQPILPSGTTGYFLQKTASGVQWAQVQSGGGAPTLTWYTNVTGTTVTISDTSSAALVKIYKNGILLEPTADYSISGTTLTMVTALVSTDKITTEVF